MDVEDDPTCSSDDCMKTAKLEEHRKPDGLTDNSEEHESSKVGRLRPLLDMPIKIFCEIASHLTPLDLRELAGSFKALRF